MDDKIKTTAEAVEADAIPRAHVVHLDPSEATAGNQPLPTALAKKPVANKSAAQWAYERLVVFIKKFEETLDAEHEIAMGFVGGDAGVLRIQGIGYFDPDILTFYGTDESGAKMQLVQHVSQLSVMLRALPKPTAQPEPTRIGFRLAEDLEKET